MQKRAVNQQDHPAVDALKTAADAASPLKPAPRVKIPRARFNEKQVLILTIISTALSIAGQIMYYPPSGLCGYIRFILTTIIAAYLPSFFDGSEYSPKGRPNTFFIRDLLDWTKLFPNHHDDILWDDEIPDAQKQYIAMISPHGSLSLSHWANSATNQNFGLRKYFGEHRRSLGGNVIFKIPVYRDLMLGGAIVSADSANVKALLQEKYTVVLLPGGLDEQVICEYGKQSIFIKERKGMFYYSLLYDVPIVPLYAIREVTVCKTYPVPKWLRNFMLKKLGIPLYIWSPFGLDLKVPLIGGKQIYLRRKGDLPTTEEVEQLHQMYVAEVTRIYEKYKTKYGFTEPLEIV